MKHLIQFIIIFGFFLGIGNQLSAQKFSATLNVSAFSLDRLNSDNANANVKYTGNTSLGGHLRFYNKGLWSLRLGAGVDNIKYEVTGGDLTTDYEAKRKDIYGVLGLEKHFKIADFIYLYPGVRFPVTFRGDDKVIQGSEPDSISANYSNFQNDEIDFGFGFVAGLNIKFLKVLRLGTEFDIDYSTFKQEIWENVDDSAKVKISNLDYTLHVTLGVAF